eukprot:5085065-Karenia_brevis.AAC.1
MLQSFTALPDVQAKAHHMTTTQRWTKDKVARQLQSLFHVFLKERFGGREWAFILIAIGTIDETIVRAVNKVIRERRRIPWPNAGQFQLPRAQRNDQR